MKPKIAKNVVDDKDDKKNPRWRSGKIDWIRVFSDGRVGVKLKQQFKGYYYAANAPGTASMYASLLFAARNKKRVELWVPGFVSTPKDLEFTCVALQF